jgi:glycosyltransferase involved in cell wall biosynthesis
MTESIRVLHIFVANYKHRFGGPLFDWKYAFSKWNDPDISHFVLDTESQKIIEAKEAFDFELSDDQYIMSRWEKIKWTLILLVLIRKLRKEFDLVHFHVLWWAGLLGAVYLKLLGIPTLYQSVLLYGDTPSGIAEQKFGKLKIWCLKKFSAIVPISDFLAEDYLKFGFQPTKVHTLMNSVDIEVFHPVGSDTEKKALRLLHSLPEDEKILLFVGSVIWRKGVDLMIESLIKAQREYGKLYLVIVGARYRKENPSIDEEFVNKLQSKIIENGLRKKVKFVGLIQDRDRLAEIYRASDIFIFPSRNEGLGNVVLEAMACALPVIVSRLPVLEKVIQDGENGIFVPIEDSDALKNAVVSIAQNTTLAKKIGKAAHQYVISNHRFEEWERRLSLVYRQLLT